MYWNSNQESQAIVVAGAQPPFSAKPEQAYYVKMLDEPAKGIDFVNRGTGSDAGNASIVITLSETPTKLYFAQGENGGWTVSDGKGEYMAPYLVGTNFGWSTTTTAEAYEWTVEGTPEDFVFVREDGKYIGRDAGQAGKHDLLPVSRRPDAQLEAE